LRFEMSDLSEGVDAGIGAACAVDEDFFLGDLAGGFGDGALDSRLAGLDLPAVEGGAVVGNGEFEVAHWRWGDYRMGVATEARRHTALRK